MKNSEPITYIENLLYPIIVVSENTGKVIQLIIPQYKQGE